MRHEVPMSYGTFVKELNKDADGSVIAYDNNKGDKGCLLHLRQRPFTIFIPAEIIDRHWSEAIFVLKERMSDAGQLNQHLTLKIDETGGLSFKPTDKSVSKAGLS